ncbi:MAG: hypothetical protein WDN00_03275 [Limisphaerales bacterium]
MNLYLAQAATTITNEFWVSPKATGNFYTGGVKGTMDHPLDGSTRVNFDKNMNRLPPDSTIHLLPGTFQTLGNNAFAGRGFFVKSGQKIRGSGMDVTILKLVAGALDESCILNSSSSVASTNIEISDLTCDGNYISGRYTYHGVGLEGKENKVRRVKVIHLAKYGRNTEAWGIVLSNSHLPDSGGNIIEDCEVSHFAGGTYISAFSLNASLKTTISGVMRNNRVLGTFAFLAFNGSWTHDVLIESNYINGANVAVYGDTGSCSNVLVTHNHFINLGCGAGYMNAARHNLTFTSNYLQFTNEPGSATAAFFFTQNASSSYTNVVITGNTVVYKGSGTAYFLDVANISGLNVSNNYVDLKLTNRVSHYTDINLGKNYDLRSNYLSNLKVPK